MSKIVTARYSSGKDDFEILVDADMAYEYVTGKRSDPLSVLEAEQVFKDAKKGERQSDEKIKKVFGTTDLAEVVSQILKKGNLPITTEQKAKMLEEKRKQIIEIIARNSIDPRTKAPATALRVENAMKEAKVSIDPFKSANDQIEDVVKKLSVILPIKFTNIKIEVVIPADSVNRCYNTLKQYGLKSEDWLSNGSLKAIVEFPAGMQNEFYDKLNKATQGRAETKILE
ncbi:MAG: ribosome assembly factor SBDS [Candidatus Marsarchaeota archaeon]|nr:ribosome assembly factor SBDS [Candidatus Marsarchaeota archaeon]MCL5102165.1 ribosome assembly factor SBDS [Candidatus Marsarchaeota archaeon]